MRIYCNLGAQTFKDALYIEKGLNVPYNKVLKALHKYDELIMSQQRKIKIKRRSYHASSVHESLEIDIAEMPFCLFVCFSGRPLSKELGIPIGILPTSGAGVDGNAPYQGYPGIQTNFLPPRPVQS